MGIDKSRRTIRGHEYHLRERTNSKRDANDIADHVRDAGHRAVVLPVEEKTTEFGVFVDGMTNTPRIKRERREKLRARHVEETLVENRPSMASRAARRLKRDTEEKIRDKATDPRTTPEEMGRLKAWGNVLGKYDLALGAGKSPLLSDYIQITGEPENWEEYKKYVKEVSPEYKKYMEQMQKDLAVKPRAGKIVSMSWDEEGGRK